MGKTRILVLSLYYPPDLAAGSFRTAALVDALLDTASDTVEIDVLTSVPNRYSSYTNATPERHDERVNVHRVAVPMHRAGMLDQPRTFARFAQGALKEVRGKKYDVVFATSSRLMTAALGAMLAKRTHAVLYLDIRDIFVDTITQVLPRKLAIPLKPFVSRVERWTIGQAGRVNLVSRGFESYFRSRYPRQNFVFFSNGVDDEFLPLAARQSSKAADDNGRLRIVYAGNIGEGQGLHTIVPAIAQRLGNRVEFRLIGDGGRRVQLEKALERTGAPHVDLLPPMSRERLIEEYSAADILFLHLNDYEAFKKVLPSKIFEYAASGKPIWAGVSGYAADFLRAEVSNVAVFPPCNVDEAVKVFERIEVRNTPRAEFIRKFSRGTIMHEMATDILALAMQSASR